ncbi:metabotropic glutamate receptor-like [Patiria miniata]|uniref:G-protein coupled receptors family 3 profile domain-containing protein n=1 Tax=Patiria miniata TaxID=46514 RepID=A0A914B7E8_PATMI|nr:metabotropic glutamate receptor-like [Patiria miniata]
MYLVQACFVLILLLPSCDCLARRCVSYSKPGDVVIGGLFPIHYVAGPGQCTDRQSRWGTMLSEAMIYAVEQINRREDVLPNVTLGYDIRDDCRSDDVALWHALALVNALNPNETSGLCQAQHGAKVLGIVGTSETDTSIVVTKAAAMYKVPLVSYAAAGDELGDNFRFPYFLRTVPENSLQVRAMLDIIYTLGWVYVSLLHSVESDYLLSALRFQEIAADYKICVAYSAAIRTTADDKEVNQIVANLDRYPKAKVVVVIGDKFTGQKVMRAGQKAGMVGRYQWIGGSRWGYLMKEEGLADISDGAIFVRSYSVPVAGFEAFARAKEPFEPYVSPWYKDLAVNWMQDNNCINITDCPLHVGDSGAQVVDSVHAIAFAFHNVMMESCANVSDCQVGDIATEEEFLQKLLAVNFTAVDGEAVHFDSSGNSGGKFNVTNLREDSGEHQVGLWHSAPKTVGERLEIKQDKIRFLNKSWSRPASICVEECRAGYVVVPLEDKCCWGCKACSPNEIVVNHTQCYRCPTKERPDANRTYCLPIIPSTISWTETPVLIILVLSGFGIVLCSLTITGLFVYGKHPLIKASSRELSSINVAGLTLTFLTCVVLLVKPTRASCITVELVLALCSTLIYAPTLLKVIRIFRIFRKARKSTQRPKFISPKHQVIACLTLLAIQVMLSILSAILAPSTPVELISQVGELYLELFCSFGPGFIASCAYNLLLILACCFFAFKARKVPSNYNESKFIAVSVYSTLVLCLAAVPVYATAVAALHKVATVCYAVILNAYLTLVCLYLPKFYAVKFVGSDDTTTSDWRGTGAFGRTVMSSNKIAPSTSGTNDPTA